MSRTKGSRIVGRLVWIWDNSHDVVVARLVEAAHSTGGIDPEVLTQWRVNASIQDLAFDYPTPGAPPGEHFERLLVAARRAIVDHGDVTAEDLSGWSVLEGQLVSGGNLRFDPLTGRPDALPVESVLDVVDGFFEMVTGMFPDDPPGGAWLLGAPGGRRPFRMRGLSPES